MASAKAMVRGPSLPMNIMMVIKIRPPVNPALNPTVPKAETVSNNIFDMSAPFSVMVSKKKIKD